MPSEESGVISPVLLKRAKYLIGKDRKIYLLPNGADTDNFKPIDKKLDGKKLGFSNKKYNRDFFRLRHL